MLLLDTCTISDYIKDNPNVIKNWLNTKPSQLLFSSVSLKEIKYGVYKKPSIAPKVDNFLKLLMDNVTLIPFGEKEAITAAKIIIQLFKAGTPIGSYDVQIAATAITHNLTLVTSN